MAGKQEGRKSSPFPWGHSWPLLAALQAARESTAWVWLTCWVEVFGMKRKSRDDLASGTREHRPRPCNSFLIKKILGACPSVSFRDKRENKQGKSAGDQGWELTHLPSLAGFLLCSRHAQAWHWTCCRGGKGLGNRVHSLAHRWGLGYSHRRWSCSQQIQSQLSGHGPPRGHFSRWPPSQT